MLPHRPAGRCRPDAGTCRLHPDRRPAGTPRPAAARRPGAGGVPRGRRAGAGRPAAGGARGSGTGRSRGRESSATGLTAPLGDGPDGRLVDGDARRRPAARPDRRAVRLRQDQPGVRLAGRAVQPATPPTSWPCTCWTSPRTTSFARFAPEPARPELAAAGPPGRDQPARPTGGTAWPRCATSPGSCAAGPGRPGGTRPPSWPSCAPRTRTGTGPGGGRHRRVPGAARRARRHRGGGRRPAGGPGPARAVAGHPSGPLVAGRRRGRRVLGAGRRWSAQFTLRIALPKARRVLADTQPGGRRDPALPRGAQRRLRGATAPTWSSGCPTRATGTPGCGCSARLWDARPERAGAAPAARRRRPARRREPSETRAQTRARPGRKPAQPQAAQAREPAGP